MGATLNFNIVSKQLIDIPFILGVLDENFDIKVTIKKIEFMDDWEYNNQVEVFNLNELDKNINKNKIVVIGLSNLDDWKMGMHIEKEEDVILYNLWFDSSYNSALDSGNINDSNQNYYYSFYKVANALLKKYQSSIIISSVGIETIFQYDRDINKMISRTYNVNAWIVHEETKKNVDGYNERHIDDLELLVFEKR